MAIKKKTDVQNQGFREKWFRRVFLKGFRELIHDVPEPFLQTAGFLISHGGFGRNDYGININKIMVL